ncbi:MAG: MFS transporter [Armatimonadetes bacterium]|nr:MFS transporter [Armatimonadota bacterium]
MSRRSRIRGLLKTNADNFIRMASLRTMAGLAVVALFAQVGYATLNFSALVMWVQYDMRQGKHLGLILGTFMLTEAMFRPWLGALSDRVGRKPLMLVGPALGVVTSVATIYLAGFGPHLALLMMILLRAVDGVGLAAFWPAAFAVAGEAVEEKSRSTAMAVVNGAGMAGVALGMLFGGLANDLTRSHTGSFYFVSLVFLITFLAGLLIFPRQTHKAAGFEPSEIDAMPHLPEHIPHTAEVRSALRLVPDMLIMSVVVFTAVGLLMPIIKLYSVEQLAMSETQFGALAAPVAAVLGLLSVPFGRLGDKWGKLSSFCYGLLICTAAMWLVATIRSVTILAAASAMIGVGFVLAFPAWMAIVSEAAPADRRGQIMGTVGMAQGIGAIVGVYLGPLIYASDWMSLPRLGVIHFNLPFYLCALLLSAGTVMAFNWISVIRQGLCGGRRIGWRERRAVVALAVVGAMAMAGWVVFRYTRPVPADRVAWLWVQATVHKDLKRAESYTLPSFEGAHGGTASQTASTVYSRRVNVSKARYTLMKPRVSERGRRAEVRLIFRYPDQSKSTEFIVLHKQKSGEWKIAGKK